MNRVLTLLALSQREQIGLLAVVSVVIILFLIVRSRMSRSN
jgi:hypothetical protein